MKQLLKQQGSELMMVLAAVGILLILFIPIPSALLDVLLICNFSWALTILLLTFYTDKPLSFSTFPALLLIATLFRLALNVSATRLILTDADAGRVIQAVGAHVIQGNYVMGLVVFLILIIVQFVVVTNGAQRVAEVAARFTLDSMPGKQMSIDADLNMGLISQDEARERRSYLEKEASFYGAMDGASKFVKGDAIAGILIVLVDIIGGFAIGMLQKGMSIGQSMQTYTLLTVGDGLVTQIPALIISVATGIIVTRAATDAALGSEVSRQIAAYPKTLIMVSLGLTGLLFLNGMPLFPVLLILAIFIMASIAAFKSRNMEDAKPEVLSVFEKMRIYPIEVVVNPQLYQEIKLINDQFLLQVELLREQLAYDLGFVLPEVKIRLDESIKFPFYGLNIHGQSIDGWHQLHLDKVLLLKVSQTSQNLPKGIKVQDPAFSLPAVWVDDIPKVLDNGIKSTDALSVLITHLKEQIQNHLSELLDRDACEQLLAQPYLSKLTEELLSGILTMTEVQKVLQNLLQERVSIRPLQQILEVLVDCGKETKDSSLLTERVRTRLALPICQKLLGQQHKLYVLTLEQQLEHQLHQGISEQGLMADPKITEQFLSALIKQVEKMIQERKRPILLCHSNLRRHIRHLTQRILPHLAVLGMNEIPINIQVEAFGLVQ